MSIAELSRRTGISRRGIAYIESGTRTARISTVVALADALGVDVADLLVKEAA